jgi:2-polyprenyl-3-methyl-5-hydroxy-6-metoxy-1,4-benzoquinol methylase
MEVDVYRRMAENESKHWWYVARTEILLSELKRAFAGRRPRILDVGCGPGFMTSVMARHLGDATGVDSSPEALRLAAKYPEIHATDTAAFLAQPHDRDPFDLLCFLDVIEHVEDDRGILQTFLPFLAPDGVVAIAVPAFMAFWGKNDVAAMHFRRYRGPQVDALMATLGFEPLRTTYFNTWLTPVFWAVRTFERWTMSASKPVTTSDGIELPPAWLNAALRKLFESEMLVLARGRLPFGVTYLGLYRRRA